MNGRKMNPNKRLLTKAKNKRAASSKMKRITRNIILCNLIKKWVKLPANFFGSP